jgi:hypothetical protein
LDSDLHQFQNYFGFGVYTYVPSLITIVPFVGPLTGVVVTTNGVPSGSISPASVKIASYCWHCLPLFVFTSLSTMAHRFTAVTVKVMLAGS